MKLILGVNDVPYADASGTTTGDVAEILEAKYGVFSAFVEAREKQIGEAMENSIAGAFETLFQGGPIGNPLQAAAGDIASEFKQFLASSEIETMGIPGVPTQAALDGINHSFKNPRGKWKVKGSKKRFVKNPRRPSFIDTSLMQSHLAAEFTDNGDVQ